MAVAVGELKECCRCREIKGLGDFGKNRRLKDGLNCYCRVCARIKDRQFRSKIAAKNIAPEIQGKFCPGCKVFLPSFDFGRDKYRSSGLNSYCKSCRVARGQTEIARARKRAYNTSSKGRTRIKRWKSENKERLRLLNKRWSDANPQKCREISRNWKSKNRDRVRHHTVVRERRVRSAGKGYSYDQWLDKCQAFANRCAYCLKEQKLTRHHIVPIAKGGANLIDNIAPACLSCNCHIHTKIILPVGLLLMEDQFIKKGVIEQGITPPEEEVSKEASDLENCVERRLADSVKAKFTSEVIG